MNTQLPKQSTQEAILFVWWQFPKYTPIAKALMCAARSKRSILRISCQAAGENEGAWLPVPCSGNRCRTCPDHVRVGDHRDSSLR